PYVWPGAAGVLAPGEQASGTATYQLTQADIDAGHVVNTATGSGNTPDGNPVDVPPVSGTDTGVDQGSSGLSLVKTADASGVQAPAKPGDVITYHFALQNTGNTTLTGVAVTDPLPGLSAITYVWPGAAGVLAPGEQASGTATYQLTQADIDAARVVNHATAAGAQPDGVAAEAASEVTVPLPVEPAAPEGGVSVGTGGASDGSATPWPLLLLLPALVGTAVTLTAARGKRADR
ncbi:hypothetical protein AB0P25_07050, partial [Leifsonia sp. NPDC077715]